MTDDQKGKIILVGVIVLIITAVVAVA